MPARRPQRDRDGSRHSADPPAQRPPAADLRRRPRRARGAGGLPRRGAGRGGEGGRGTGRCRRRTRPTSRWSRSTRPGSRDLDQALHLAAGGRPASGSATRSPTWPRSSGPGGAVDAEARRRGRDALQPGPAHPAAPAGARRGRGQPAAGRDPAGRAVADRPGRGGRGHRRRRAAGRWYAAGPSWAIPELQAAVDAGTAPEPVALLPRVGELRLARARARHATELDVPEQEVVPAEGGGWTVVVPPAAAGRAVERAGLAAHRRLRGAADAGRRHGDAAHPAGRRGRRTWSAAPAGAGAGRRAGRTAPTTAT